MRINNADFYLVKVGSGGLGDPALLVGCLHVHVLTVRRLFRHDALENNN